MKKIITYLLLVFSLATTSVNATEQLCLDCHGQRTEERHVLIEITPDGMIIFKDDITNDELKIIVKKLIVSYIESQKNLRECTNGR